MLTDLFYLLLTYLLAAVPFGIGVTTLWGAGIDIRAAGSGNIGATNVARVYGWRLAGWVVALDVSKGFLPTFGALLLWPERGWWSGLVAAVAFIGHCWPVYLEFKGGKGVATGAGALLALAPLPSAVGFALWSALLALTGRSSVAALGATLAVVGLVAWLTPGVLIIVLCLAMGIAVRHYANIRRLMAGEEQAVIRPVRWRRGTEGRSAEAALGESPAGESALPPLWRTHDDPLDEESGVMGGLSLGQAEDTDVGQAAE